jgi:hypothetical protein
LVDSIGERIEIGVASRVECGLLLLWSLFEGVLGFVLLALLEMVLPIFDFII